MEMWYLCIYICILYVYYMYILIHYIYMGGIFVASCWLRKSCGNVMFFFKKHEPVREEIGIPERMPEIIQSLDWGSPTTCTDTSWCSIASPGDKGTGASTKIKGKLENMKKPARESENFSTKISRVTVGNTTHWQKHGLWVPLPIV